MANFSKSERPLASRPAYCKAIRSRQLRKQLTQAEIVLWSCLKNNRLGGLHFRRRQVLLGFIADFYCFRAKLVIELDGPIHELQKGYDIERQDIFESLGFKVLRFTNDQVLFELHDVLNTIRISLQQHMRKLESTHL
jgi:very-short-patch-repair endonuclease